MCRLFGKSTQMNIDNAKQLLYGCQDRRRTSQPILDLLNDTFTLEQFKDMRRRYGLYSNVRPLITYYIKMGRLKRLGRGVYRKVMV